MFPKYQTTVMAKSSYVSIIRRFKRLSVSPVGTRHQQGIIYINDTGTERYVICNGSQDPDISVQSCGFQFPLRKKNICCLHWGPWY